MAEAKRHWHRRTVAHSPKRTVGSGYAICGVALLVARDLGRSLHACDSLLEVGDDAIEFVDQRAPGCLAKS